MAQSPLLGIAQDRVAEHDVRQADAEPATFGVPASCLGCGGPLELLASGVPTASRTETRAVLKCRRNGCRREHLLGVTLVSADARELAS